MGFPGGSVIKNLPKNPPAMQEMWARFLGQEDHLEKEMACAILWTIAKEAPLSIGFSR